LLCACGKRRYTPVAPAHERNGCRERYHHPAEGLSHGGSHAGGETMLIAKADADDLAGKKKLRMNSFCAD
jgi:hypothetical protein